MVHIWTKSHMINSSIPKIVVRFGFKSRSSCGPAAPWRWSNTAQILRGGALPFPKRLISSISFALWWWCQVLEGLAPKCTLLLLLLLVCVCVCVHALPSKHTHSLYKHTWLEINSDDRRVTVCNIASGKDQSKEVIHNPKPETRQSQAKSKLKCSNAFISMISAVSIL